MENELDLFEQHIHGVLERSSQSWMWWRPGLRSAAHTAMMQKAVSVYVVSMTSNNLGHHMHSPSRSICLFIQEIAVVNNSDLFPKMCPGVDMAMSGNIV